MTSLAEAPPLLPGHPVPYHFTAEQSLNMAKAAIFGHEDKLELIHGVHYHYSPRTPRDCFAMTSLMYIFLRLCCKTWVVRTQSHIVTADDSIPCPDASIVEGTIHDYCQFFPTGAQTLLAVEVADSSLRFDLGVKLALYAAAKIPEYWVVDLAARRLYVHTLPRGGKKPTYRRTMVLEADAEVPLTLRGEALGSIRVTEFLP